MFASIRYSTKRMKSDIRTIQSRLDDYEKIIIMSPVWAGRPVPAINNVIESIPTGKKIELIMVSAGGGTKKSAKETKALFIKRGCEVAGYTDAKVKRKNNQLLVRLLE